MSTSGGMKTLAFHPAAQGKSGRMPELSVKHDPRAFRKATRRQEAANEHQQRDENLGFSSHCLRKVGQDARAFRQARSPSFP